MKSPISNGYLRTWRVPIILCSSGIICTIVPSGPYPGGLAKVKGKFNRTTTPEKMESEALCMHTTCVHAPHTHIWSTVWKGEWQNPQILSTPHYSRKSGSVFFLFLCKTPAYRTTIFTAKPTPHTFDGTALQQQLLTIFSLPLLWLLVIDFELAHRLLNPSLCTNLHAQN